MDDSPRERCGWCGADPLYRAYHDEEWGVPAYADNRLFEFLILEGAQAGLSWLTILRKREHYRRAFAGFDPQLVARFGASEVTALLGDPGIVRNRLKIEAAIKNAQAVLRLQDQHGSLAAYLWRYVDGQPQPNAWPTLAALPARTATSDAMSRDLKAAGCNFVGPTICYAFMQAVGMVNDHVVTCFRYPELGPAAGKHG
jgi:DNA-3-methyladenine glycosylase I